MNSLATNVATNALLNKGTNLNSLSVPNMNSLATNSNLNLPEPTTLSETDSLVHGIGKSISDFSNIFVNTGAEIAAAGINNTEVAAKIQAQAGAEAAADLSKTAAKIVEKYGPEAEKNLEIIGDKVGKIQNAFFGSFKKASDVAALKTEEEITNTKIQIMMASRPGLTEQEARRELEEEEKKQKEEERRLEEIKIKAEAEAEAKAKAEAEAESKKSVGGKKSMTFKQIQRGGKMAAKRTQKSIKDFLNSSVTSSHILNMVKKGGKRSKRRRRMVGKIISKKHKIRKRC
jgi:hypothetical protein